MMVYDIVPLAPTKMDAKYRYLAAIIDFFLISILRLNNSVEGASYDGDRSKIF